MQFRVFVKFFIFSALANLLLIGIATLISGYMLECYIQPGSFLTQKIGGRDFLFLKDFYTLFFWYLAPLSILVTRRYKKHLIYFFVVGLLTAVVFQFYLFTTDKTYAPFEPFRALSSPFELLKNPSCIYARSAYSFIFRRRYSEKNSSPSYTNRTKPQAIPSDIKAQHMLGKTFESHLKIKMSNK